MALVSLRSSGPLDSLLELQRDLESLLQHPARGLDIGPSAAGVFPALNAFRASDGTFVVRAEVPGIKPDALEITVEPRRLTLRGNREIGSRSSGSYHRRERQMGNFARSIQLPEDLDPAAASAACRNGLLTVRIPQRESARPRQITVQHS
jgi:HSP20 family protein